MTLFELETLVKSYAQARAPLSEAVVELSDNIEALKRRALPRLKRLVAEAAARELAVRNAIESARWLFEDPRTVILHGIKLGLQKGKGVLEIPDAARTLARIKELYDCPENYIRCTEEPDKKALATLPAADLKRLGCAVTGTDDQVIVKPADSAVDKIVNALLKDAAETEPAQNN